MRILSSEIQKHIGKKITMAGWVHKIRKLGGIAFIVLRDREGLAQAVVEESKSLDLLTDISTESVIEISGTVAKEERAPHGAELRADSVSVISKVSEELPVEINKKEMRANLDTLFDWRQITLRSPRERAIFKVQAMIVDTFRDFLGERDFTEINTPKIVKEGLETGGAEMFDFKYFGKKAFLSQSPQMYKQILVGVYERVFETAFIYRAEKHNTSRHLNEYLSLDLEMGFIESWEDIMDLEEEFLKVLVTRLEKEAGEEFKLVEAEFPKIGKQIPRLKLHEVQEILEKEYKEKCVGEPDLEPNQEKQISDYVFKKYGSDFVFITHYPTKKRPFYAMDDPENKKETLSFDLLCRGLEITTGGQRMHLYEDYLTKMKDLGMDPKDFDDYLVAFRYGMPTHGGLAIGAERITARFLGLNNVKEASMFPRVMQRLRP